MRDLRQVAKIVAQFQMFELKWIVPLIGERINYFVAHPFNLSKNMKKKRLAFG